MGGDFGIQSVIPAAEMVRAQDASLRFLVFGDRPAIEAAMAAYPQLKGVCEIVHCDRKVANDDKPSAALRAGKGTSMYTAIEAVRDGKARAVVSAGNTGALMAMAKMVLRPLEGIHRPAIAGVFPTMGSDTVVLDLGANVLVDAENLVQFAVMGAVFAKAHKQIGVPTVGLLNVGTEETKGPDHVRAAGAVLSQIDFPGHYFGFVEGNDITTGKVDVVVSDGYAGNIALKTAEGVSKLSGHYFREALSSDPLSILGSLLAYFAIRRIKRKVDPRLYNGGVFLGLNGLCVKSHGGADALGFSSAILLAARLARHGYIDMVSEEINHLIGQQSLLSPGAYQE